MHSSSLPSPADQSPRARPHLPSSFHSRLRWRKERPTSKEAGSFPTCAGVEGGLGGLAAGPQRLEKDLVLAVESLQAPREGHGALQESSQVRRDCAFRRRRRIHECGWLAQSVVQPTRCAKSAAKERRVVFVGPLASGRIY